MASADIPNSLKSACSTQTPHTGYSYRFCNDGLPPSGGTTPNQAGMNAVKVPAKYQATGGNDWTGLPPKAADALTMPGADNQGNIALDIDISVPTVAAPPGGYPLMLMMHGCCAGNKTSWEATSFDAAGEKWHYNNAWFASRGYVVITYTSRGFVSGEQTGNMGSTGETQLDSRRFEINDYQHLAGLVADDPFFNVNPQKVVTTGGSYGGGFSWLALTDPIWTSPGGRSMKMAASAPKYGWTDLVYSLVPTGTHFQTANQLPAFNGSDSSTPLGLPKKSIVAALYDSGKTGIPPGSAHTTFPAYVDEAVACLQSTDPFELNPLCATPIAVTLPSFINDRSAYYQNDFFAKIATDPAYRIPVFNAATFTDPLFTPVENLRMSNRLQEVVPDYPIQQYFGDYQHFVQNKPKEWGDICGSDRHVCNFSDYAGGDVNAVPSDLKRTGATTRLNRFIDHYAQPPGNPSAPQPAFDVTASLQICPDNAGSQPADEPGDTFTAPTFDELTPANLHLDLSSSQTTTNNAEPNLHAVNSEPVANSVANGGRCPVETQPPGPGVATFESGPLAKQATMVGASTITIYYSATNSETGSFQLNTRMYDVFPDGKAVMVDRGVRRVTQPSGSVAYQLHGNGWRFPAGHKIRVEIAQDDDPFVKASNVVSSANVSTAQLDIPIREGPSHPRPNGAAKVRITLVPAFDGCSSPTGAHGAPLSKDSCSPAQQSSDYLTVPNDDTSLANGSLTVRLFCDDGDDPPCIEPGDQEDVRLNLSVNDVRRLSDSADYGGELEGRLGLRISDAFNGPAEAESATLVDTTLSFAAPCTGNSDPAVGSACGIFTSADTIVPGMAREGKRANWELDQLQIFDGGADGLASTTGDNTPFLRQAIFVP